MFVLRPFLTCFLGFHNFPLSRLLLEGRFNVRAGTNTLVWLFRNPRRVARPMRNFLYFQFRKKIWYFSRWGKSCCEIFFYRTLLLLLSHWAERNFSVLSKDFSNFTFCLDSTHFSEEFYLLTEYYFLAGSSTRFHVVHAMNHLKLKILFSNLEMCLMIKKKVITEKKFRSWRSTGLCE